jgi:SAM-dependent methyltransferase
MDPKTETTRAYDAHVARFDERFEAHMREYNMGHATAFLEALPGRHVLDIGCGPGNYAVEFAARGFEVLCGDLSEGMVRLCRTKGLRAQVMDLETFELDARFDGVWANASLLHLRRSDVPAALARIVRHLVPGGVLGMDVKEGTGERMEEHAKFPGARRWFCYFSDAEIRALVSPWFDLLRFERTPTRNSETTFLKYVLRLRDGVVESPGLLTP